jgi:hypothetical protein
MGEVGRTDQFQHCQSADDVIMPIEKDGTLGSKCAGPGPLYP